MKISEKQIMQLMKMLERCLGLFQCKGEPTLEFKLQIIELIGEIINNQSPVLKVVE